MTHNRAKTFKMTVLILILLLLLTSIISLNLGAVSITPSEVWQTLTGNGTTMLELILFDIRLPSIVLAILVGACIAISGTIMQSITNNDLADPGILGVNAGSGLAVLIFITLFQTSAGGLTGLSTFILPLFSFLGALLTAVFIILFSWKKGFQSIRLILVGIAMNTGLGAILIAMQLRLDPHNFAKAMVWLSGDLWATQWSYIWALLPWIVLLVPYVFFKANVLNVLHLGNSVATGLGIRTNRERIILLITAVALAGLGVSAGGGIVFLGLISPHIARRIVGPAHQLLLPTAALIGSLVLLIADTIGKNILLPTEIPAGLVVSIVSVPYFIYLLLRAK